IGWLFQVVLPLHLKYKLDDFVKSICFQLQDGEHGGVVKKRKVKQRIFLAKKFKQKEFARKNDEVTMIIFIPRNTVYLPRRKKMNASRSDQMRIKIDLMLARAIDKNTNFIVAMP